MPKAQSVSQEQRQSDAAARTRLRRIPAGELGGWLPQHTLTLSNKKISQPRCVGQPIGVHCVRFVTVALVSIVSSRIFLPSQIDGYHSAEICPGARMRWDKCEVDGVPKIVFMHGVDIFGWPAEIPFECPGKLSVRSVETLLRGFRKGTIRFEQVPVDTLEGYAAVSGSDLLSRALYAGRVDTFENGH